MRTVLASHTYAAFVVNILPNAIKTF